MYWGYRTLKMVPWLKIRLFCITSSPPIADPQAVMLWQRALCEKLGLRGRILISKHGINGTLGGEIKAVKAYTKETRKYPGFKNMEFKWSEGGAEDFPACP